VATVRRTVASPAAVELTPWRVVACAGEAMVRDGTSETVAGLSDQCVDVEYGDACLVGLDGTLLPELAEGARHHLADRTRWRQPGPAE